MDNALPLLLKNISGSPIYDVNTVHKSNKFNIFEVLGITNKEVLICRFLGELLDPIGRHREGPRFLESFIKTVLRDEVEKELLADATVELEEVIKDNRRVDIAIHIGKKVYPIEVKIWAGDQDAQLNDYYSYYNNGGWLCEKIYYLTPDGHKPSSTSTKGLDDDKIVKLSFKENIKEWIKTEIEIKADTVTPVYVLIDQFKGAIETMCAEYKKAETVLNHIFQKEGDIKTCLAALAIIRHKDAIIEEFQYRYLDSTLVEPFMKAPNGYEIHKLDQSSDERKEDSRRRYKIVREKKDIAFICIDSNLYLKLNEGYTIKENEASYKREDGLFWWHLCSKKEKKINLKDPTQNNFALRFDDKIVLDDKDLEKIVENNKSN